MSGGRGPLGWRARLGLWPGRQDSPGMPARQRVWALLFRQHSAGRKPLPPHHRSGTSTSAGGLCCISPVHTDPRLQPGDGTTTPEPQTTAGEPRLTRSALAVNLTHCAWPYRSN
jgi:hypothetical protein